MPKDFTPKKRSHDMNPARRYARCAINAARNAGIISKGVASAAKVGTRAALEGVSAGAVTVAQGHDFSPTAKAVGGIDQWGPIQ